jgi:N-acetylneuraminic acid mutarotase
MTTTEETLVSMRHEMRTLLEKAMEGVLSKFRGVLENAEQQRVKGLADIAKERTAGLAEVAKKRATALAEVDARCEELTREVDAMHKHKEAQEGHVALNIGGYRFETSVQTLRRVPHTFFDAYFSGRYAQDVCDDGSIFVDRDGEHFGHILQYMRDGVVSVADPGACPSVSLLRALKREFGFYCIELVVELEQPEMAYVMGGIGRGRKLSSMERYDPSSGQWSVAAAMSTARSHCGVCVVAGEAYVTGGVDAGHQLSTVAKYTPSSDTWSAVAPLPTARAAHAAVVAGSTMYVLGGHDGAATIASVLNFDSTQDRWSQGAPMPAARYALSACAVGRDIYVFGGVGGNSEQYEASVFKLDTEADAWSTLPPMPHASAGHTASLLDGLVYIVGAGGNGRVVLSFDPASGAWRKLALTTNSRRSCALFVLDGCMYAAGGAGQNLSVERYNVASDTWAAVADMLEGRGFISAVTIRSAGPAKEQDIFDSLIVQAFRQHP